MRVRGERRCYELIGFIISRYYIDLFLCAVYFSRFGSGFIPPPTAAAFELRPFVALSSGYRAPPRIELEFIWENTSTVPSTQARLKE
jgi:hypothetical protein